MNLDLLQHVDVIHIINNIVQLPDDAVIDTGLAALFLGVSEKTLARYRQNDTSPPYIQYPLANSTARNQKIKYKMGDLRVWRGQHSVNSTMDAAVKRGMAFCTISDVNIAQPFWTNNGEIINHALASDKETFTQLLNNSENKIIWLNWQNALENPWQIGDNKENFLDDYKSLLTKLLRLVS